MRLICAVLREFIEKSLKRIKKVTREDWNEFIYFALDSLWAAALETDVMTHMSVKANEELVEVFRNILTYRVSNSIKEYMADIAGKMEREYALKVLGSLKGRTGGGNARRAYNKSLKYWNITEEEL